MDQVGTGVDDANTANLAAGKESELGLGNSLDQNLLGDTALSNALERLDGSLGSLLDGRGLAVDLDGEETSIRVGVVGGLGLGTGGGSLGQEGEAGRPLDGGLAAEETGKDGSLGAAGTEGGTGESDNNRVLADGGDALLTTVVLGGDVVEGAGALGRDGLEEGLDPLLEAVLAGTVGDNGDVGLGVGSGGKVGNGLLVQVGVDGCAWGGIERGTEARVESDGVGGIEGNGGGVHLGLLLVNDILDLLVELVSCSTVSTKLFPSPTKKSIL